LSAPADPTPIEAVYFDGRSARPQRAALRVRVDGLEVRPEGAAVAMHWPFAALERVEAPADVGLRLACDGRPDERVAVTGRADAERLVQALPRLRRARTSRAEMRRAAKWFAGGLAGLALLGLVAFEGLPRAFAYLPMGWVAPIGDNVARQIGLVFGGRACAAPAAEAALAGLAERLLDKVEPTTAFDPAAVAIRLVESRVPNAFAAPGGRIVVFSGLFDLVGDDAVLDGDAIAGVVAHEIAHARLRHPTAALGRAFGLDLLARLAGGGAGANAGLVLANLAYGREAEREADALARAMLIDAGIGDAGLVRFFEAVERRFGAQDGGYLSTHPATAERIGQGLGVAGPERAFGDDEWLALKAGCAPAG